MLCVILILFTFVYNSSIITFVVLLQEFGAGTLVRNSKRDSKKGDKMQQKWLGPYAIVSKMGNDLYQIKKTSTNKVLKQAGTLCY